MEKNAHFGVHANASFALRGFVAGTSGYSRMDGVHGKLPSNQQPMCYQALTKLPHGHRAIHVTRTLSEATRGVVSNRPLSPHLPLKKPQLNATFSISHRIFGASLASAILLIPIAWKFSLLSDI
ncbi:succinate dehydrogenase subunit 3-1, mitochondrial [Canna indica]|uniref:Succinate dehydrogenase subunit 3-1, mitochondrial n=1 Tax=Canna indica TaxID=4628 RepID=A0AAQ3K1F6_9LILI|nr:succinate dehydrogenase subunit 3-1, mitochondrial [Canna indica]